MARKYKRLKNHQKKWDKGMSSSTMSRMHTKLRRKGYTYKEALGIVGQAKRLSKTAMYTKWKGRNVHMVLNYTPEEVKEFTKKDIERINSLTNKSQNKMNYAPQQMSMHLFNAQETLNRMKSDNLVSQQKANELQSKINWAKQNLTRD